MKPKYVVLRCVSPNNGWVIMTLETIASQRKDLQQISIHIAPTPSHVTIARVEGANHPTHLSDFDRLLVRFWDSRSIRPKAVCTQTKDSQKEFGGWAGYLLPEIRREG